MSKYRLMTTMLALCLLYAAEVSAQYTGKDPIPVDPMVKIGKLPNGLTYYIRENKKPEKKVQLRLVVNTGSILEDADQQGLAHFMEHMNFNGTKHFPRNELVSYLQSIGVEFGADLNAYTSFDETVYILPIPTDDSVRIEKGFTVLEDWAGNALLDPKEIDKERGVVLEESRLGKGADERMEKVYLPRLFNGSRYAERLPIGKDSILKSFKPEVLKRFYQDWYRPDLIAVVVVGDIDPALAEKKIIAHFSHFKNPKNPRPRPAITNIAERTTSEAMVLTDKEQPNSVLLKYDFVERAEPATTWGDYRETVLQNLYSLMLNQRFAELTQQPEPPFVYGGSGFGNFLRGYKSFNTFAVLGTKPVQEVLNALVTTEESVKRFGFTPSELERAKSTLLNQMERTFKDRDKTESGRLVQDYVNHYLSQTPLPGITNLYAYMKGALPGIQVAEVNALGKKLESSQGKFVLLLAPDKEAANLPKGNEVLTMLSVAQQLPVKPYEEKTVASTLLTTKPVPGKIVKESANSKLGTYDYTLSNGITVTLRPTDFKNDEIQMDAWRLGGYWNYELADKNNAEMAANFVRVMGVGEFTPTDLRKYLAGKTVNVSPYINAMEEGIEGNSSVKDFETFLQLINLFFTVPRKDPKLFDSYLARQKAYFQNLLADPFTFFRDTVTQIQYNHNPWAEGIPRPSDFDKIQLDRSFNIYQEIFGNAYGLHFTFVGNLDPQSVKTLLETYLGSLPSKEKQNRFRDVGLRPQNGVTEAKIYRGEDPKSLVRIIFSGEAPYSRKESLKLQALAEVLNIKIIEQLREEMSGIYGGGMSGNLEKRPYNHYTLSASFPCGPENVDKLTAALFDIIDKVQQKGIEPKDLDKVKETWREQNLDRLKQNNYWLSSLSSDWIEQENPEWILDFQTEMEKLTTRDIQDAARKYLDRKNYLKAVLYPEKKKSAFP